MKKWLCFVIVHSAVGVSFAVPPKVDLPEANFKPAQVERVTLSNGVVLFLLEDHELPLFNLNVRMKTSPADAPRIDDFSFLSEVWRTGGTKTRPPEKLDEELEDMSASVETSADLDLASVSLSCLSKDLTKGLEIFADVLFNPGFRADQLSLAKAKAVDSLRRKNETPPQIARRAFRDVVYGKQHVYAYESSEESIKQVTAGRLSALHGKIVVPEGTIVCAAGDFQRAELIAALEKLFAAWKPAGRVVSSFDYSVKGASTGTVFFVYKDAEQSRITMGRAGPTRHSPDHFSLALADYILGGGGASRLFGEIRSRLGLAYVVGSFVQEPTGPGLNGVACQTKAESTVAAILAIRNELKKFADGPISEAEITLAKDATINSFVFGFDSAWELVNSRAVSEFYGYAPDYIDRFTERTKSVRREEVQDAAKRYFSPEIMRVMVVGDKSKFDPPLDQLGPATTIPVTDIR